jgi:hypothetical protein
VVIRLPEGNLTGQFVAIQGPAPREAALTGGTGRCRSAGGEGTLVEFGNGRGRMTLQVLSFVSRGKGAWMCTPGSLLDLQQRFMPGRVGVLYRRARHSRGRSWLGMRAVGQVKDRRPPDEMIPVGFAFP